jgi:hypothetical protein
MSRQRRKKEERTMNKETNTLAQPQVPSLSVDDLEISDVDVYSLIFEDGLGVPELGASSGPSGCCTCCNCCPPEIVS